MPKIAICTNIFIYINRSKRNYLVNSIYIIAIISIQIYFQQRIKLFYYFFDIIIKYSLGF